MRTYVEERNGGLYVAGTRISLDSVIYEFNRGSAPESILHAFPNLGSLENVYGAITFYLADKPEIDEYLGRRAREYEEHRTNQEAPPGLRERIAAARAGALNNH